MKNEKVVMPRAIPRTAPSQARRFDAPVAERPIVETFRLLALSVQRLVGREERRSIAVLSAWPDDGRSLVALSLARALAEMMPPVLMVDADPAGSGVSGFGIAARWNGHGGDPFAPDIMSPNFRVLTPPRNWPQNPIVFLEQVQGAIDRATSDGMTVVLDTPACTTSSIAFYMAQSATGVLYLARRRPKTAGIHQSIRAQLDLLGVRVLGVVFNEG